MFRKLTTKTKFYMDTIVKDVKFKDDKFIIFTNHKTIEAKKLIVASGGLSYPSLGATDIGFKIAKKFGHNIITPNPALVGFTVQKEQFWFKELSGLSLDEVHIKVGDKICKGSLLFTHKGCSGPVILSTSLYWGKGQISIDFAPYKDSYLPKRFKKAIQNSKFNIHNYSFSPAGNFGYSKAEVTKGGVDTSEINVQNMESKLQNNLYFIGEVLNITGELGGYNFQWAFSSSSMIFSSIQ
jgi:predicted flavoprotein YhiN